MTVFLMGMIRWCGWAHAARL